MCGTEVCSAVQARMENNEMTVEEAFLGFLRSFTTTSGVSAREVFQAMYAKNSTTIFINFDDIVSFHDHLAELIRREYTRYEPCVKKACVKFVKEDKIPSDDGIDYDVINVAFYNLPNEFIFGIRNISTSQIGELISVTGFVTKTSDARVELLQGTFKCLPCGGVIKNVEQQFKYTKVDSCPIYLSA